MRTYKFEKGRDTIRSISRGMLVDISPSKHTTHYLVVPRVKTLKVSIYNGTVTVQFGKSWALEIDETVYEQYEDALLEAALGEGA